MAGRSRQPAEVSVGGLGGLKADPGIDGLHAVRAGENRAQLQLGDLRQVVGHLGDAQQQVPQRGEIDAGSAGMPEQERRGAYGADQLVGIVVGQRGEPRGAVSQRIGGRTAGPNSTSGPTTSSCSMLIITSTPPVTIGLTMTPASRWPNASLSERNPRRTSSAPCRSMSRAPAPRARTRPGTSARSATGPPNRAAAATAASSVTTPVLSASGTP